MLASLFKRKQMPELGNHSVVFCKRFDSVAISHRMKQFTVSDCSKLGTDQCQIPLFLSIADPLHLMSDEVAIP